MQESESTGVIYMISNTINNKKYIGKAYSYEKHGNRPSSYYGAKGRFRRHKSNANKGLDEIPLLYEDMRTLGSNNFNVSTLEICLKENLKEQETHYIKLYETFKKDKGYNYYVGDNKPEDEIHKEIYENKKISSNKNRANDGKLRQSEDTKELPPNIYKRKNGLFAQIKIGDTLYNKGFLSSKDTDDQKLEKAKTWLKNIKQQNEVEI